MNVQARVMIRQPPLLECDAPTPLTAAEQARVEALLRSVSTQTLLHSLTGLERDSEDARLLIAVLMDRLPSPEPD